MATDRAGLEVRMDNYEKLIRSLETKVKRQEAALEESRAALTAARDVLASLKK